MPERARAPLQPPRPEEPRPPVIRTPDPSPAEDPQRSDVREHAVERARHPIEVERVDEQARVADLAAAAAAHEPPQLLGVGPPAPRRLPLERADGAELALCVDHRLDRRDADGADQLVLQVGVADVKAEALHLDPCEAVAQAGPLEPAPEVALLAG